VKVIGWLWLIFANRKFLYKVPV